MRGEVCWLELSSPDAEAASAFYGELFGWTRGDGDVGFPYHFLRNPPADKNFGGIASPQPGSNVPPHWFVYFAVPDLDAALATAAKHGGKVCSPVIAIPTGKFAVVADPHGATFAVYQPA